MVTIGCVKATSRGIVRTHIFRVSHKRAEWMIESMIVIAHRHSWIVSVLDADGILPGFDILKPLMIGQSHFHSIDWSGKLPKETR